MGKQEATQNSASNGFEPPNASNGKLLPNLDKSTSNIVFENNISAITLRRNLKPHVWKDVFGESTEQRRTSRQLKDIPESKRPYYGTSPSCSSQSQMNQRNIANDNGQLLKNFDKSKGNHGIDNNISSLEVPESPAPQKIILEESTVRRRVSPRLKNIPESKRPYYGSSPILKCPTAENNVANVNRQLLTNFDKYICNHDPENTILAAREPKSSIPHVQEIIIEESAEQRRVSLRCKRVHEIRRHYCGTSLKDSLQRATDPDNVGKDNVNHSVPRSSPEVSKKDAGKQCKSKHDHLGSKGLQNADSKRFTNQGSRNDLENFDGVASSATVETENVVSKMEDLKWLDCNPSSNSDGKGAHARVKETLKTYNTHYLHFVQEEEKGGENGEINAKKVAKGLKRKKMDAGKEVVRRSVKRFDLKTMSKMLETKEILYPQKRIGNLPGIDVGFRFYSRAEMVAIGFHGHWLNGIDYMGDSYSKLEYKGYTFPLAVSIVISGQYEDDVDNSEDVLYTGQGGNDLNGSKRQFKDQEMSRGNLALKNNMEQSLPVRVVRGNESGNNDCRKIYIYDGLYQVVQFWSEKGASGFIVYKFRLKRIEGQPKLTSDQVRFTRAHRSNAASKFPGLVSMDISGGQEAKRIPATNVVDDKAAAPTGFTYTKSIQVAKSINLPPNAEGCNCKGYCTNTRACACARLNGTDFPYVRQNGGRLIEPKDVVFECGPNCGCGPGCINRTSQQGIKYNLEVFQTPEKGWAVRSRDFIPSGAPVCEYIGVLKRTDELDNISENDYIFEIDCLHTMKGIGGRERRSVDASVPINSQLEKIDINSLDSTPEFCIDAGSMGNVARFINHSCEPNLFVQCVLSPHHDARFARVVLFAAESIAPFEELTYDYGYALDSVVGPDGKVKELLCHCGTADCRKRLY